MLEDAGFKFDMGSSFILMPDFFEELFSSCGEKLSDHIKLARLDPSYKIFYSDGDCLTVHQDSAKTKEEIERFEPGASNGFDGLYARRAVSMMRFGLFWVRVLRMRI